MNVNPIKQMNILIIDDDLRNIFALKTALKSRGLKAEGCISAKEGLYYLEKEKGVDIVLLDMMMPEFDGFELLEFVHQSPRKDYPPIIAVTAKAMMGDRERCILAGADGYVAKPVDIDKLLTEINRILLAGSDD